MVTCNQRGLSLIELLAALVVLSVLIGLAAPSFSRMIAEQRLREASSEMRVSLATARSEAVKRGQAVLVTPREADNWSSGWCVGPEESANGCGDTESLQAFIPSEQVLVEVEPDGIRFNSWGRLAHSTTITLTTPGAGGTDCCVSLGLTHDGRVISQSCDSVVDDSPWLGACP